MSGKYLQDSLFSNCKSCYWIPLCLHLKQTCVSGSLQAMFFFLSDTHFKCQCLVLNDPPEAALHFLCWPHRRVGESSDPKMCRSAGVANLVPCFWPFGGHPKCPLRNVLCLLMTSFGLFKSVLSSFGQSEMLRWYYCRFRNIGLILLHSLS